MTTKRKKTKSPTARTMEWLRKMGYRCAVVEKRLPRGFVTVDLFGVFDIVAMKKDSPGILAIQVTSGSNHAARKDKVLASADAALWADCGGRIWVMSWRLAGMKGARKLWEPRMDVIKASDFPELTPEEHP